MLYGRYLLKRFPAFLQHRLSIFGKYHSKRAAVLITHVAGEFIEKPAFIRQQSLGRFDP
jgi:hypothetical protein